MAQMHTFIFVLAIDPGEVVGIALAKVSKKNMTIQAITSQPWDQFAAGFAPVLIQFKPFVVIERSPQPFGDSKQAIRVQKAIEIASAYVDRVWVISPGDWKPVAERRGWATKGKNQHEHDAMNMIRFYAWNKLGAEPSEKDELK